MKALIGVVVVVVLLGGGLFLADRAGDSYASGLIAQYLTNDLHLSKTPHVDVVGTPFLTQWASGHYQEIDISMASVTADSVTVDDVDATVKNVSTRPFLTSGSDIGSATAGSVNLEGEVPFSALPLPSGFTATASGSQLKVTGSVTFFGASVPVTAIEKISLNGSTVSFKPTQVQASADGFKVDVSGSLAQKLAVSVSVSGLPFGVQLTDIAVAPGGLAVTAAGQNVSLASG